LPLTALANTLDFRAQRLAPNIRFAMRPATILYTNYIAIAVFALAMAPLAVTPAHGGDFASDLAKCAKGPIDAAKFALGQGKKAAEFVIDHGECVGPVVGGDPLLYGMTFLVAGLQASNQLPHGAQACVDASIGQASKAVAGVVDKALDGIPGGNSLLPSEGRTLLKQIAQGQANKTLYQVPGVALIMDRVSCSCAVASTGLDIEALKEQIKNVVDSVEGCAGLVGKLLSGIYNGASQVLGALGNAAKDFVNGLGCTLGLGGCSDDGPPFFCVGYHSLRAQGQSPQQIASIFPSPWFPPESIAKGVQACEQSLQDAILKKQQELAQKAEDERIAKEAEKAEKLGAASALGYAFRWIPKCADAICKSAIAKQADYYTADIQDPETLQMYGSFGAAKFEMDKKYGARAELAIAASKFRVKKALMADANAPPADRLAAFDCRLWLGRQGQSLCPQGDAFRVCQDYARQGQWQLCVLAGGDPMLSFAAGRGLDAILRGAGCIPDSGLRRSGRLTVDSARPSRLAAVSAQCLSGSARVQCDALMRGGSAVSCQGPSTLALNRSLVLQRARPLRLFIPKNIQIPAHMLQPVILKPLEPIDYRPAPTRTLQPVSPGILPLPIQPAPPRIPMLRRPLPTIQTSTLCRFTDGPRQGQVQDYAPMDPIPVGSNCQDGRGSSGVVVGR
jgi:hypothetical protein